jgi:hypothetical protein
MYVDGVGFHGHQLYSVAPAAPATLGDDQLHACGQDVARAEDGLIQIIQMRYIRVPMRTCGCQVWTSSLYQCTRLAMYSLLTLSTRGWLGSVGFMSTAVMTSEAATAALISRCATTSHLNSSVLDTAASPDRRSCKICSLRPLTLHLGNNASIQREPRNHQG